jgi:hypothetical protein
MNLNLIPLYNHLILFYLRTLSSDHLERFTANTTLNSLRLQAAPECILELLEGSNRIDYLFVMLPHQGAISDFIRKTTTVTSLCVNSHPSSNENATDIFTWMKICQFEPFLVHVV